MAPRKDLILFCDLETTGVDADLDSIIEVGIALYSWPAFEEVGALSIVVKPTAIARERMDDNDIVRNMHKANGLYDEIERGVTSEEADEIIDGLLAKFGTRSSGHIPLAGSGVTHFDRRFIKRYLPKFDGRLTHWAYDVGVLRRMFILAGARYADDSGKTHRALDDARVHAEEFAFYMDAIRTMADQIREANAA